MTAFLEKLQTLAAGYREMVYQGKKWGVTVERLSGDRQIKLYGEELGGSDHVSFNLYLPTSGKILLKPCEMPEEKVVKFVLGADTLN